jgi:hypothetical protein
MRKLAAIVCSTLLVAVTYGQTSWNEQFSHNNPGLYTNLNGGTNNLTIENGIAQFTGQRGAYFGRTDLTPDSLIAVGMTAYLTNSPSGLVGIGWHHPSAGTISAAYDQDAGVFMIVEHTGFGFNVLDSVSTGMEPIDMIYLFPGWVAEARVRGTSTHFTIGASTSVVLDWNSHFMMYGGGGASGPGKIDWVFASTLPEPGTYLGLGLGLFIVGLRKRR